MAKVANIYLDSVELARKQRVDKTHKQLWVRGLEEYEKDKRAADPRKK